MEKNNIQNEKPLLKIVGLKKYFPLKKTKLFQKEVYSIKANDGIDLVIHKGETLGLVGESGCGKSTFGRLLLQLYPLTDGKVFYYGQSAQEFAPKYLKKDIRCLPSVHHKTKLIDAKIEEVKKEIERLKSDQEVLALHQKYTEEIKKIESDNKQLFDECMQKYNVYIVANDYDSVFKSPTYDKKIAILSKKIVVIEETIKKLETQKKNIIENPSEKILEQIKEIENKMSSVSSEEKMNLENKKRKLEQKLKNGIISIDFKIRNLNETLNDAKSLRENYINFIKTMINNNEIDLTTELLNELIGYKEMEKANVDQITKLNNEINFSKLYNQITKLENARKKQFDKVASTSGAFVLSENIKDVEKLLFEDMDNRIKCKNLDAERKKIEIKKFRLSNFIENETLKDNVRKAYQEKIQNLDNKIVEFNKKIDELKAKLQVSKEEIKNKKKSLIDYDRYDELEDLREKGIDLTRLKRKEMDVLRRDLQIIFQDPYSSLNPRMTVGQIIGEGVSAHQLYKYTEKTYQEIVEEAMEKCGVAPYMIHRYPHQFSGGQRQRIGIARALALDPKFVVCDEAVSALDVSIQSQIINLLEDLRDKYGLTYLFISHDLSVIKHISNRIGVMYLGKLVELSDSDEMYLNPLHPYTKALISAIPTTDQTQKKRIILEGDIPSNVFPPSGCKFRTRCPIATKKCAKEVPLLKEVASGHFVACHYHEKTKDI